MLATLVKKETAMGIARKTFDRLLPSTEPLWERSGATISEVEIEPGRTALVPDYHIGVDKVKAHKPEPFIGRNGLVLGQHIPHTVITSDGVDRAVNVTLLDDQYQTGGDFFVSDSTAWFTDVNGYAAVRDNLISEEARVNNVRTGAEHSAHLLPGPLDVLRLGKTIVQSRKSSLTKSAQSDQAIVAEMVRLYSLPPLQYGVGDSQAGMRKFAAHYYGAQNRVPMGYMDIKALCAPDNLEIQDVSLFLEWFGTETIGGTAIVATMLLEDEAEDMADTVSLNPNFIISSLIGGAPSLASGEAGRTIEFVPRDALGHVVHYGKDKLADVPTWKQKLEHHPNIHQKTVEKGIHAHLLRQTAHTLQRGRVVRFGEQLRAHGDVKKVDPAYVHAKRIDEAA